ncbi:hypothetical protein HMPREF1247_1552 [Atopobium sp. BV3Ac4]|nr:hypothetical protein HMPREF1247_1552 [Atopobium sp. BV3Ac4]
MLFWTYIKNKQVWNSKPACCTYCFVALTVIFFDQKTR